ncbi:MAG: prepilin-type N-terminal cleavage/methylation domain-containing protein [Vulcanimicrobiota bacterium]
MNRRGLTLLEALVSLALIFLVLGTVTDLLSQAQRTIKHSDESDRALEAMAALNRVRHEVDSSIRLIEPDPSGTGTSSRLVFERIRADYEFPSPAYPAPSGWTFSAVTTEEVTFAVEGEVLFRQVDGGEKLAITNQVNGFAAEIRPNGNLHLALNLIGSSPYRAEVWRP